MKREMLVICAILSALAVSGCQSHHAYRERVVVTAPPGEVVVTEAPPPPRIETYGQAPSPGHLWVQGYWSYRHHKYVWVPGHWERRPRTTAIWVPGQWTQTSRGWVWAPGHWN